MSNRPVPTAFRVLRGNPSRRPLPASEPKPPLLSDETPPDDLSDDPEAQREWTRLVALLRHTRVLTDADRSALCALCRQWSAYVRASASVRKAPIQKNPRTGMFSISPMVRIATHALAECHRLWIEFGLTPVSRTKVSTVDGGDVEDTFAKFERGSRRAR